jgi:hypothetical protein
MLYSIFFITFLVYPGTPVYVYAIAHGLVRRGDIRTLTEIQKDGVRFRFVGRGIAQISRDVVFSVGNKLLSGVGILMTEPLYKAPCFGGVVSDQYYLQNWPSYLVGRIVNVYMLSFKSHCTAFLSVITYYKS